MLPLLIDTNSTWRNDFLIEHRHKNAQDEITYDYGVRNLQFKYVEYVDSEGNDPYARELYDLVRDPFELDNLINDQLYSDIITELAQRLDLLKQE